MKKLKEKAPRGEVTFNRLTRGEFPFNTLATAHPHDHKNNSRVTKY